MGEPEEAARITRSVLGTLLSEAEGDAATASRLERPALMLHAGLLLAWDTRRADPGFAERAAQAVAEQSPSPLERKTSLLK